MTDDQVEKVARAIEDALDAGDYASGVWLGRPGKTTDLALFNAARAAIAAMDDGWQDIASAPRNQLVLIANSGLGHVDRQIACRKDYAKSGWVDQWGQPIPVSAKPTRYHLLPSLPGAKP